MNSFQALVLLLCVGAGTVGGVFFAFSAFVLRALEDLPPARGIAAIGRRILLTQLNIDLASVEPELAEAWKRFRGDLERMRSR